MSRGGYYPRRRGILEHLERGTVSLLDTGIHDFLCLTADYKTGICWSSAEKIRALCPTGVGLKQIQRSLQKLERLRWIRRYRNHGDRGNYPILIGRYFVRDMSHRWKSTNIDRTTDWRNVQFDDVTDPSLVADSDQSDTVTDSGLTADCERTDSGPIKEVRSNSGEDQKPIRKDDDDDLTEQSKAIFNVDPRILSWARGRILKTVRHTGESIKSRRSYVRASLPEFLKNLTAEIDAFLEEKAVDYLRKRSAQYPGKTVLVIDIHRYLASEASNRSLPCDEETLKRVVPSALDAAGFYVKER